MRGPRTHSAGTAQIARQSGGDSMPVDYSSALESTLSRIRQRYALYFNLPPGVRRGEERRIEVSMVESTRQRYPNSEVRYRRVYLAPVDGGVRNGEPMTITRSPVDSEPTAIYRDSGPKRRPAVSDAPPSRQGPLDTGGGWRSADAPAPPPPASANKPPASEPSQGGWRKATPEEK